MVDNISYFPSMMPKVGEEGHSIQIKRTLLEEEYFNTLVMRVWKSYETPSTMKKITMKLKNLKNKCVYGREIKRITYISN